MTSTSLSLFESRLIDDLTFRTTTGIVSVASGSTLVLHLEHDASTSRQYLITSTKFSSDGPISVSVENQPDSVTPGTELTIKNNTTGLDASFCSCLSSYQDSTFSGAETLDEVIAGSETTTEGGVVRTLSPGSGGEVGAKLNPGGDLFIILTNLAGSNTHNCTLTLKGAQL